MSFLGTERKSIIDSENHFPHKIQTRLIVKKNQIKTLYQIITSSTYPSSFNMSSCNQSNIDPNTSSNGVQKHSTSVPTQRTRVFRRVRWLSRRSRAVAPVIIPQDSDDTRQKHPHIKEADPFLYYSQSRHRLDELRYASQESLGSDSESDFDDGAMRKCRFSTEVHALHDGIIGELLRELEH